MTKLFKADIPVFATVYVKAETEEQARNLIKKRVAGDWLETADQLPFSGKQFSELMEDDDPDYEITYSPAMTVASWEFMEDDLTIEEAGE